jgi:hypothetical protein
MKYLVLLFLLQPALANQCQKFLIFANPDKIILKHVSVDKGVFAEPGQTLLTVGVSTCTVLILTTDQGRKYMAHILPSNRLKDYLPELNPKESAQISLHLGPLALVDPYLSQSRYSELEQILKLNPKIKESDDSLSTAIVLSDLNIAYGEARYFNLYMTDQNQLIFEYK